MTEGNAASESAEPGPDPSEAARQAAQAERRISRITRVAGVIVLLLLVWYLAADRCTPSTSTARVSGYVVPVVPEVSGHVTAVNVGLNQRVAEGDVLVSIDEELFALEVEKAEAELARAGEDIGADTGGVAAAAARVEKAKAELAAGRRDKERIDELARLEVASQFRADNAKTRVERAVADLEAAEADLATAREKLGATGGDNARIRSATAELAKARRNLELATLRAPTDGGVTNVRVEVGRFAQAGRPLMTFISSADVWVEAYLRENSLGHIQPGDRVDIVLDVAPGRVFEGRVVSTGFGVDWGRATDAGTLPSISNPSDWLREPQRFPVVIHFTDDATVGLRREGGQADVIIYTERAGLLRPLGKLWIRAMSLLSYLY